MRVVGGILLLALGAAGAIAADRLLVRPLLPGERTPAVERSEPETGDPPVVWIDGTLERVEESQFTLARGRNARVTVERFAGNATRFFRIEGGEWRQLANEEVPRIEGEPDACIEALVDGEAFLAIRVFVERLCAPG